MSLPIVSAVEYPVYNTRASDRYVRPKSTTVSHMPNVSVSNSVRYLFGKIYEDWEVLIPISLQVEQNDDNGYIVSDSLFAVYGVGDTLHNAWKDYVISLIEYYEILERNAEASEPTRMLFDQMKRYLRKLEA